MRQSITLEEPRKHCEWKEDIFKNISKMKIYFIISILLVFPTYAMTDDISKTSIKGYNCLSNNIKVSVNY